MYGFNHAFGLNWIALCTFFSINLWCNPFRTVKAASNGNHRLKSKMSKIEPTSKMSLKLASRINLGRRGASTHQALDFRHIPQASPQSGKS